MGAEGQYGSLANSEACAKMREIIPAETAYRVAHEADHAAIEAIKEYGEKLDKSPVTKLLGREVAAFFGIAGDSQKAAIQATEKAALTNKITRCYSKGPS